MPQTIMKNYSFMSKLKKWLSSSVILIICTVLALICANLPATKDWYFSLWQNTVSISIGNFNFFFRHKKYAPLKFSGRRLESKQSKTKDKTSAR